MSLTKQKTQEIITKFQAHPGDTGNAAVQVALITERINYISSHLKINTKDHHGELGLIKLVGQRKRLLKYIKANDMAAYQKLIKETDLRK